MGDFDSLFADLDADSRVRGREFEHICKWFLSNDPVYSHELKNVCLWHDWEHRWGIDAGIDLVGEDRNGNFWAIQAKAYDPKYRVTKKDVDKFLAESGRKIFTYRMLIATTDLIDRIGERTIQDQEKRVTFFRLNDLRAANVDWPDSPKSLRPMRTRRPARAQTHQQQAIREVMKGFKTSNRGQLIMACGTGKTLTALFTAEKLGCKRTLVLLPSLSLLKQTLNVWRANCTTEFLSLPVCSDETVATTDDAAVTHTSDIGLPITTDAEEIASFLRQHSGPQVVFATYQSSPQIAKAYKFGRVPGFDLVIADEAHRCAGPASSGFATVLDPVAIGADRRLFMTATPRYFTGRVLKAAQEADYEIASMDDEAKFGPVFHRLTFGQAIDRALLTDYQVVIVGVDDETYREWAEKGVLVTRDGVERISAASLAGQIGLAKAMKKYDLRRVISFHSRVARAREFAVSMPDVLDWMPARQAPKGKLWSRFASGEMPAGDRYVLLQHLGRLDDGDRGLLSNARCLAEGVDVPTLDGVAFIDPRRSEVDIVQAVGRAIRRSDDKTVGTVVIPVFIDTEADPEVALDSSEFKPVWDVIKALRAHDAELGAQLDELRRELGRMGGQPKLPDKIHIDIPTRVGADFARAFDVRLVEQTTQSWEFWYGLLENYVAKHGTAWVRGKEIYEGQRLGQWVIIQRTKWEMLSEDRRDRLNSLPGWTTDVRETQWEEGFRHLQDYVVRKGDARVRDDYVDEDGYRLGKWVGKQRTKWKTLTEDQRRRLDELDGWIRDVREAWWEEGFKNLQEYAAQHGSTSPLKEGLINGFRLGQWTAQQRQGWDSLTEERQMRLKALPGWTLNTLDAKWDRSLRYLEEYVSEHGHANVPQEYFTKDGYGLGKWVSVQRAKWDSLSDGRRRRRGDKLLRFGEQIDIKVIASAAEKQGNDSEIFQSPDRGLPHKIRHQISRRLWHRSSQDSAQVQSTNSTVSRLRAILSSPG
jgi:superfamily II DNA or RNA helicase